jgi:hypothetical protein
MPSAVIRHIKNTPSLQFLIHWKRKAVDWVRYIKWIVTGKNTPVPQLYKISTIKRYGRRYKLKTFIETGTLYGETTKAVSSVFERVVTIELDDDLHRKAMGRFKSSPTICCVHGDSAQILPNVLKSVKEASLFWLDGHYSAGITARGDKDTPINDELSAICRHSIKNHVILIDDASLFTGENDYPTMENLKQMIEELGHEYNMFVENDIIRIHN